MHGFAVVAMAGSMHESILILDTDHARRAVHALGLSCAGFRAPEAIDARTAHLEILRHRPSLVLLFCNRLALREIPISSREPIGAIQ